MKTIRPIGFVCLVLLLTGTAYDNTKVVQAIEYRDHPFMIGVQWHPEYRPYRSAHQGLFRALVDSAVRPDDLNF